MLARRAQGKRVFALARPGLLEACNPELQALFRAVIYAFSIWVNKQTPGNMFMNLVFANSYAADTPRPPGCVHLNLFVSVCVRERDCVCEAHKEKERVVLVRVPLYFMSFINLYYRHVIAHILLACLSIARVETHACTYKSRKAFTNNAK